jgi:hypothetical protein
MIGRKLLSRCVDVSTVVLLLLAAGCGKSTPNQPAASPVSPAIVASTIKLPPWQPDPALLEQLGPYQDVAGYQIRLPKDYDSIPPGKLPSGQKLFTWMGPMGPLGTALTVKFVTLPPENAARATLNEVFDKALAQGNHGPDWQCTPAESGQIAGHDFLRAGWQYTMVELKQKLHGLTYVTKQADKFIKIQVEALEPIDEPTFKLAAAAILTFRQKAAGEPPAPPPADESAGNLPVWEPNPKLLEQLDPYQAVGDYEIRPPKGYESKSGQEPGAAPTSLKRFYWSLPRRQDNTSAALSIIMETAPLPQLYAPSLRNQLAGLSAPNESATDWQQKPIELGTVNGITFARRSWQCVYRGKTKKTCQFRYVSKDSGALITILAQDEEPYGEESLKLLNAAALTFRKK